jgi:hypothetical protein
MTRSEAKQVLALYRGAIDDHEPEVQEALALARSDPDLKEWLDARLAFHAAMRDKLRQIKAPSGVVPSELARSLAAHKAGHLSPRHRGLRHRWQRPALAMAALFVLLGVVIFLLLPPEPAPDRFANYQSRMVGTALRQYRMDILTNDMRQVRQFLAERGAPADYQLPAGLQRLQLTGAGALQWRSNPVAMVCFDRGDDQMLFLFITKRSALKDPPPQKPQVDNVSDLVTVSWTEGDMSYLLAGPPEPDFHEKYL